MSLDDISVRVASRISFLDIFGLPHGTARPLFKVVLSIGLLVFLVRALPWGFDVQSRSIGSLWQFGIAADFANLLLFALTFLLDRRKNGICIAFVSVPFYLAHVLINHEPIFFEFGDHWFLRSIGASIDCWCLLLVA